MNVVNFAICDDEPSMVQALAGALADYLNERSLTDCSVSRFSSGRALLASGGGFDVIFLDIQMAEPDGMETARLLRRRGEDGLLIFVTVLKELVFDAFQVDAFDYLLKPLDRNRFRQTMDRALRALERRRPEGGMVIRRSGGCEVVPLPDLIYCEVQGRKVYLHRRDGTVLDCYGKLEDLERRVDSRFFKCHRSYLVNLDYVRGYQDGQVTLSQGERIPVSRLRERELAQALLRHMKEGAF